MKIRKIPLAKIKPAKYNPRKDLKSGDPEYERIKTSIDKFGLVDPLVWNEVNGVLIGGHQRLKVLKAMKRKDAHCSVVHIEDEAEEKELNIALNRASGSWDPLALKEMVMDLEATGKDLAWLDLEELMPSAQEEGEPPLKDPEPSEPPEKPRSKRGVIYMLGKHRLMCGDATDADDVETLVGEEKARMVFTDPPWNVAIGKDGNPRHRQRAGLVNDDMPLVEYEAFLKKFAKHMASVVTGDIYVILGAAQWPHLDLALRDAGFKWSATIIWVKDIFVLGRSKYHRRYEPLWYGWPEKGKSSFRADRSQDDVWEIARPRRSPEHPTMKPIDLCATSIRNSSQNKDIVLDLFGGAGSTLIACEQLGRVCYMMELDPGYVDVIRKRFWKLMTGEETGWEAGTKP